MSYLLVLAGLGLIAIGVLGRAIPGVVTGISLWSVLHFLGLALLLFIVVRRRREVQAWVRARDTGRHVRTIVIILYLLLAFPLVYGVNRELELGRQYDRVRPHLENDDPVTARTLAGYLPVRVIEDAALRRRIIERIVVLDDRHPDVTGALVGTIREDPDRAVRTAAVAALGRLITPRDILLLIRDMTRFDEETRKLVFEAFIGATGVDEGADPAAWRKWFGRTWGGADPDASFDLALMAYRDPGGDETLRSLALDRIRTGEGADTAERLALAADSGDAGLRRVAATLLGTGGDVSAAGKLGDILLRESDEAAARAQVSAIRALDPSRANRIFHRAAEGAAHDVGRAIARAALLGGEEIDGDDPSALTVLLFRREKDAAERGRLLSELMRMAGEGPAARRELSRIAGDAAESGFQRLRALGAMIRAGAITSDELVGLFGEAPDREFREALRRELRKRTGKDAGIDAKAWAEIVSAVEEEE